MVIRPEHLLSSGSLEYVIFDASLCMQELSPGASRLADHPESAAVGNDLRLAFPEFVGAEEEILHVAMGTRSSYTIRSVCRITGERSSLYVDERVRACPPSRPEAPSLMLTLEDVTLWMAEIQRKSQTTNDAMLLINAMTASKEYIENILEAMADMLIVTSSDGTISAVNRAAVALTEYPATELIGQPITFLLPDETSSSNVQHTWQGPPVERTCVTRSGGSVPVSFSRAPLGSSDQAIHGVVFLGRDLRDQKRAEARISRLESEKLSLQEALKTDQTGTDIVFASTAMGGLMRDLGKVAVTDTTVLITGETGTGKELIAREIHRLSPRKDSLLVTVNCAALPAGLVESELFGHEKGSFTGALQKRVGRFELANGGTVFLDEIGELPHPAQATLLRVLQEQTLERVGGSQAIGVNVRVIAATNRDLQDEVRKGRFRDDLLFRLNVFPLPVPPLRERVEDIPLLARHFVQLFARRTNRHITSIHPDAMRALRGYRWPGNVRELANVIERAMIVCEGSVLEVSHLALVDTSRTGDTEVVRFDDIARRHLLQTLEECEGVIEGAEGAAAKLGLKPATLRSRLKKLGISRTRTGFTPDPSTEL